jgi:hypothetical protein
MLLPKELKDAARGRAERLGVSLGEYVRTLIENDLNEDRRAPVVFPFPFGNTPVRSGRTHGSEDHDRPESLGDDP